MGGEPLYASPAGSGSGTQADPASLTAALAKGQSFYMLDGIYNSLDTINIQSGVFIRAATGARPVITRTDDKPPAVEMAANSRLYNIWLGGLRDEEISTELHPGNNSVIEDCVFCNYVEAIGEGAAAGVTYRRNKFIGCGSGELSHSLYINNAVDHTASVLENIFIGGEAYHVHIWHNATNTPVRNNFSSGADFCVVPQGANHIVEGNIFWKPSSPGYPVNLSTGTDRTYTNNYHGPIASGSLRNGHLDWFGAAIPGDVTASGNHYYTNTLEPGYDPNSPTTTNDGDEGTLLGKSTAQIDAAISALETAFAGTVQQIHDSATIETHFATLKAVIDTWKLQ
jgi:hypothetical protein